MLANHDKAPTKTPTEAQTEAPTKAQTKAQSRCGGGVISVPPQIVEYPACPPGEDVLADVGKGDHGQIHTPQCDPINEVIVLLIYGETNHSDAIIITIVITVITVIIGSNSPSMMFMVHLPAGVPLIESQPQSRSIHHRWHISPPPHTGQSRSLW